MIRLNLRLKANKQLGRKREKGLIMTRERCTQKDKILVTIMTSQFRSGGFYRCSAVRSLASALLSFDRRVLGMSYTPIFCRMIRMLCTAQERMHQFLHYAE